MTINNDNYYDAEQNKQYMSVSQYKSFQSCEARAIAMLNGEWDRLKSKALLVGSYVDAWFEGTLDKFKAENEEIFSVSISETPATASLLDPSFLTRNGTIKKDKLSEAKKLFPNAFDISYKLKADFVQAEEIIERVQQSPMFMEFMSGEKQVIRTGELFGVPWKIKIDSLLSDKIVDLKVMVSMDRVMGKSFIEHWGYDVQMAVYQAIEGNHLPTYLAVVTKEKPSNLEIIHIPQWRLDECLEEVKKNLPRIIAIKQGLVEPERCGLCDYCRGTKRLVEPIDFEDVGFSNKELKMIKGEL